MPTTTEQLRTLVAGADQLVSNLPLTGDVPTQSGLALRHLRRALFLQEMDDTFAQNKVFDSLSDMLDPKECAEPVCRTGLIKSRLYGVARCVVVGHQNPSGGNRLLVYTSPLKENVWGVSDDLGATPEMQAMADKAMEEMPLSP